MSKTSDRFTKNVSLFYFFVSRAGKVESVKEFEVKVFLVAGCFAANDCHIKVTLLYTVIFNKYFFVFWR